MGQEKRVNVSPGAAEKQGISFDQLGRPRWWALAIGVGIEAGLGIVAIFLGWLIGCDVLAGLSIDLYGLVTGLIATVPLLILFFVFVRWPIGPFGEIKDLLDRFLYPFLGSCTTVDLALISLCAGLGEELLFRGLFQSVFVNYVTLWPGLVLASLLFGLAHAVSFGYVLVAGVIGLYLGGLWLVTGNLLAPIVCHGVYDFVALVYYLRWRPPPSVQAYDDEDIAPLMPAYEDGAALPVDLSEPPVSGTLEH